MNDQDRRFEILDKLVWRPARIHRGVGPGRSSELPIRKPKLFGRAIHAFQVVDAVMRHEHLELEPGIVVVSLNPVDHVTAIAGSGRPMRFRSINEFRRKTSATPFMISV